MGIDNEAAQTVIYDVMAGRPEKDSRLTYTGPIRKFRETVEAEWAEWHKENPEHSLAVPSELPRADIKVPKEVAEGGKGSAKVTEGVSPEPITGAEWLALQAAGYAIPNLGATLSRADWLALEAAGHPVPVAEKSGGDHYYGAWKGGGATGGGGPAGSEGAPSLDDLSNAFDKAFGKGLLSGGGAEGPVTLTVYARDRQGRVGTIQKEFPSIAAAAKSSGLSEEHIRGLAGKGMIGASGRIPSSAFGGGEKASKPKGGFLKKLLGRESEEPGADNIREADIELPEGVVAVGFALKMPGAKLQKFGKTETEGPEGELGAKLEEKGGDHFYGAWKGGGKSGGGGPAPDTDKDGKFEGSKEGTGGGGDATPIHGVVQTPESVGSTFFGKPVHEFPTLAQARAMGPSHYAAGQPGAKLHPSEKAQMKALGLKHDSATGRIYRPGGATPRAPKMTGKGSPGFYPSANRMVSRPKTPKYSDIGTHGRTLTVRTKGDMAQFSGKVAGERAARTADYRRRLAAAKANPGAWFAKGGK